MADVGSELGLEFSDLSPATKDELRKIMPPFASITNPMDVTAEAVARPGLLTQAAEVILTDPNVDNLVMFFGIVPGAHERARHRHRPSGPRHRQAGCDDLVSPAPSRISG